MIGFVNDIASVGGQLFILIIDIDLTKRRIYWLYNTSFRFILGIQLNIVYLKTLQFG